MQALPTILPLFTSINKAYNFKSLKAYDGQEINDVVSDLMPKIIIYSSNKQLLSKVKGTELLEQSLLKLGLEFEETRNQFIVLFKSREIIIEPNELKQKIMADSLPKEFFGRKVSATPDLVLKLLEKSLQA